MIDSTDLGNHIADLMHQNDKDGTLTRYGLRAHTIASDLMKQDDDTTTIRARCEAKAVELVQTGESFLLGYYVAEIGYLIELEGEEA